MQDVHPRSDFVRFTVQCETTCYNDLLQIFAIAYPKPPSAAEVRGWSAAARNREPGVERSNDGSKSVPGYLGTQLVYLVQLADVLTDQRAAPGRAAQSLMAGDAAQAWRLQE